MTLRWTAVVAMVGVATGMAAGACWMTPRCECSPQIEFAPGTYRVDVPDGLGIRGVSLSGAPDDGVVVRYEDVNGRRWRATLRVADEP